MICFMVYFMYVYLLCMPTFACSLSSASINCVCAYERVLVCMSVCYDVFFGFVNIRLYYLHSCMCIGVRLRTYARAKEN